LLRALALAYMMSGKIDPEYKKEIIADAQR
jgi:hypothetical protein